MSATPIDTNRLKERLFAALPAERGETLRLIAALATQRHLPLYMVGGFVRDLLLGFPGLDFDLVTEGPAADLARAAAARLGGRVTVHPRFLTAQWFPPQEGGFTHPVDFVTARSETYRHPGALPTVRPGSLRDDLQRRDFSLNCLALRLDREHLGELRDDLGGLPDLQAGVVRVLHPDSFIDDPTRLLRLVRYERRYTFSIDPATLALIPAALSHLAALSAERTRHELDLVLEEASAAGMLNRLAELGVLPAIHPALAWDEAVRKRLQGGLQSGQACDLLISVGSLGWCLWLMSLPRDAILALDGRLHFDAHLRDLLLASASLFRRAGKLAGALPSRAVEVLDEFPLRAVQAVRLGFGGAPGGVELGSYLADWRHVKPHISGHDLKRRGLPPGPEYTAILKQLRRLWLDGEIKTKDEESVQLEQLLRRKMLAVEARKPG